MTTELAALAPPLRLRLVRSMCILLLVVVTATAVALAIGRQPLEFSKVLADPFARTLFFRLRLPRVLMGLVIGASLALTGGALQALFRNPLADPYTLGVSGGGAVGASLAIAMGWSARVLGVSFVFVCAFAGAMVAVTLVRALARTGTLLLPGALLLSGVVVNLISSAAVLTIQYVADPNSALRILR